MSRKLRPLAALAVIALLSAGCSNAPAETGSGGNENADNHEKAVKFAQCMRDNGVEDFPDPTENGPSSTWRGLGASRGSRPRWRSAAMRVGVIRSFLPTLAPPLPRRPRGA